MSAATGVPGPTGTPGPTGAPGPADTNNATDPDAHDAGALGRTVDLPMALSVALKQVIGGGVIVLTGSAVRLTGAGAPIAYALACAVVLVVSLPYAVLGAARPVTGGLYRWPARFIAPEAGFLAFWMVLGTHVGLAAYATTFGVTLHALWPAVPARPAGLLALAAVLGLNLVGTELSGRANIVLVAAVAIALTAFAAFGVGRIDPHRLLAVLPHGWVGLLGAAALLTFPISGATLVSELAGEMRRPGRDVPIAILGATAGAAALYVVVAAVAAGVPGGSGPLTATAERVLGTAGGVLFGLGAGLLSMLGIMNTHILWGSRSVLMVCRDGWLPRRFGAPNRRGVPVWPLLLLGAIGAIPVALDLDVADVIRIGGLGACGSAILSVACAPLNARADPAAYAASPLAIRPGLLLATAIVAIGCQIATVLFLLDDLPPTLAATWVGWVVIGLGVILMRRRTVTAG